MTYQDAAQAPVTGVAGMTADFARLVVTMAQAPRTVEATARARLCVLDLIGVMVAGAEEPGAGMVRDVVGANPAGPCTIANSPARASASDAALANGTAAHALDFEDVLRGPGHPTTTILPAALAVAEREGATGAELLTALVIGMECATRIGRGVGPELYDRGFHSTGAFGAFGAAAASGYLLGLDAERLTMAFGIAGTQAAGLKAMFGTMSKPLHAGRAAAGGVLAADLAARGFTSAEDVLGHPLGFVHTHASGVDVAVLSAPVGENWAVEEVGFKAHASCYLTHATIEALVGLRRTEGFTATDVVDIELTVPPGHVDVCHIPEPETGLEAKFSLRHTAAMALVNTALTQDLFTDDVAGDPAMIALRERVTVRTDPAIIGAQGSVVVSLADGRALRAARDMRRPEPDLDMLTARLVAKFESLCTPRRGADWTRRVVDTVLNLEQLDDVRVLTAALATPAAS
ncbi:MmgE/PrpD family protein [Streptomyces sp. NPDC055078]